MRPCSNTPVGGFSTIELLIAFSAGILFLTAAIMISFSDPTRTKLLSLESGQATALGTNLDNYTFSTSTNKFGDLTEELLKNWTHTGPGLAPRTQFINTSLTYITNPIIIDISPCLKEIISNTSFSGNTHSLSFETALGNSVIAQKLGGDCDPLPPTGTWEIPSIYSTHPLPSGKPVAVDVHNGIAYIIDDMGGLFEYNTAHDTPKNNQPFSITPYNDSDKKPLNDIDVATIDNRRYGFITRNDTTNQFQVIDITSPDNYSTSPTKTLRGTRPPSGSFPQGWRVYYYDERAYVTTRETAGSEFHIFDVHTPLSPNELGPGLEINGTTNDFLVTSVFIEGTTYTLALLATDRSANEIMILDVTNSSNPTILTSIDLPTSSDALCLQLLGNTLYIGRQKTTNGPELIIYHLSYGKVSNKPTVTPTQVGVGLETGFDITAVKVAGKFAFIGNPLTSNELQIWDISRPANGISRIDSTPLRLGNKITGIDFESPFLFLISQANSALQVLTSTP